MSFEINLKGQQATNEELLKNLVEVAVNLKTLHKKISKRLYDKFGNYSSSTISNRFGSWNTALQQAGLDITEQKNISIEDLFKNIEEVWIAKGQQPSYRDMSRKPSKFHGTTYPDRFGIWNKALIEFSAYMNSELQDSDVMPTAQKASSNDSAKIVNRIRKTKRDISHKLRFSILLRDGFRCMSCGKSPLTYPGVELHVDHIIPWSEGGETIPENLQTKCKGCNLGKGNAFCG